MSPAYQRFLDFFQLTGTQRMQGPDGFVFDAMTPDERRQAWDFLWARVAAGGTGESVDLLFWADEVRAALEVPALIAAGRLRPQAEVVAAWNVYQSLRDPAMLSCFVRALADANPEVRGEAACRAPAGAPTRALLHGLREMVLHETDRLAYVHARNKLLQCHGVTEEALGRKAGLRIRRALASDDISERAAMLARLERDHPVAVIDG